MSRLRLPCAALFVLGCCGTASPARAASDVTVTFDQYSPLASATELTRRTQTPTTFDRLQRYRQATGRRLAERTVDLARERFDLFLPATPPAGGRYGLLVWISPHEVMPAPYEWRDALDRHGIILVSARGSGNDQSTLERRLPLALHAVHNLMRQYPVDPERVYAGGFSGGSRAALRLAVDFPDVFRGALLNAGSDVLGGDRLSPPSGELMALLQARSRLVYATGARDLANRRMDAASRDSMQALCVQGVANLPMSRVEHAPVDRRYFARALGILDAAVSPEPEPGLETCRTRLAAAIDGELAALEALLEQGEFAAAGTRLGSLDMHRGGLAAPRSIVLARRLAALLQTAPEGDDGG